MKLIVKLVTASLLVAYLARCDSQEAASMPSNSTSNSSTFFK